jgi:hypothetical protein
MTTSPRVRAVAAMSRSVAGQPAATKPACLLGGGLVDGMPLECVQQLPCPVLLVRSHPGKDLGAHDDARVQYRAATPTRERIGGRLEST